MEDQFSRAEMLLGKENMKRLETARVAVVGVGGGGGYTVEALARCGVGTLDLVDNENGTLSGTCEFLGETFTFEFFIRFLFANTR